MIILGLDPGTARVGWGLIQKTKKGLSLLDYGCIKTKAHLAQSKRLVIIHQELEKLLKKTKPKVLVTEKLFFFKNLKTAISVSQSQGVILLVASRAKVPVFEYTPLQVKQALSGYGRASKIQIQKMVSLLLKLDKIPKPDDAADGLALAICHAYTKKSSS